MAATKTGLAAAWGRKMPEEGRILSGGCGSVVSTRSKTAEERGEPDKEATSRVGQGSKLKPGDAECTVQVINVVAHQAVSCNLPILVLECNAFLGGSHDCAERSPFTHAWLECRSLPHHVP